VVFELRHQPLPGRFNLGDVRVHTASKTQVEGGLVQDAKAALLDARKMDGGFAELEAAVARGLAGLLVHEGNLEARPGPGHCVAESGKG
jgi:hypothetical protein